MLLFRHMNQDTNIDPQTPAPVQNDAPQVQQVNQTEVNQPIEERTLHMVLGNLGFLLVLALIYPVAGVGSLGEYEGQYSISGYVSGFEPLFLGWLGLILFVPSWYWWIPATSFIRSLGTGAYVKLTPLKAFVYIVFFTACIFMAFSSLGAGSTDPFNDLTNHIVTSEGSLYFYGAMLTYLIALIVIASIQQLRSKIDKAISIATVVSFASGIIIAIVFLPGLTASFGENFDYKFILLFAGTAFLGRKWLIRKFQKTKTTITGSGTM